MVLLYCIINLENRVALPQTGVRGAAITTLQFGKLQCVFGRHVELENVSQQDALDFHAVVDGIFKQVAIIPFRFPTLLASEAELQEHLKSHIETYQDDLRRVQDFVQMELRIGELIVKQSKDTKISGAEYLQSRSRSAQVLISAAEAARQLLRELIHDWRQAEAMGAVKPALRCYALIARSEVQRFRETVLSHSAPEGITMALSGPWPATAFMSSAAAGTLAQP